MFAGIVDAAVEIYAMEGFNNPIPPLPSDPIEQGRWRDELRIHAIKMHDAPKTLGLFTGALTRSLTAFRDALPETVLVTTQTSLEWRDHQPPLTVPAPELIDDIEASARFPPIRSIPEINELRLFQEPRASLRTTGGTHAARQPPRQRGPLHPSG